MRYEQRGNATRNDDRNDIQHERTIETLSDGDNEMDPRAEHLRAHQTVFCGVRRAGEAVFMKFKCKYCSIIFSAATFEQIEYIQDSQCYVTMNGVNHDLTAVFE